MKLFSKPEDASAPDGAPDGMVSVGQQAGGANHAESVPHLVEPRWHDLGVVASLPLGCVSRMLLGEVPLLTLRDGDGVHVLADRCSHLSGPLPDGEVKDGCATCPWHGSTFRVADGSVSHGPATAPRRAFQARVRDGVLQVCLPAAG